MKATKILDLRFSWVFNFVLMPFDLKRISKFAFEERV